MKLDALIKKFSNDMELGFEVRKLSWEKQNSNESFTLEKKDIYTVFKALHLLYSSMYEDNNDDFKYVMTLLKKMKEHCYWTDEDEKSLGHALEKHQGIVSPDTSYKEVDNFISPHDPGDEDERYGHTNCIEGANCD